MIDVLMLSFAKNKQVQQMTQRAIDSVLASEPEGMFNIIVIETAEVKHKYCQTINPNEKFAFNKFLGYGYEYVKNEYYEHRKNEYLLILNNDIEAKKGFGSKLIEALNIYDSVSPACPRVHRHLREEYNEGFGIWTDIRFCGWAFMMKKELIDRIGFKTFFPEFCEGWYSDNIVVDILQKNGLKHALIKSSKVEHQGQKTLNALHRDERKYYMQDQFEKYEEWKNSLVTN